ncbi:MULTISPECIES: type VI secretion system-associated protein TagF [Pseudoalteromonas]|uniref:Type VI secretion protein n=2 Tax=Pseudoalteromonas TaxID=53246 RepID=A0ABD3YFZ8_9GAMM|nr:MULTISPECIES: type VI secretion system-associated protein TagF [Pseudoalteromonas]ALQ09902.1 type VI secretion protein [Pseudoalteromonas sp. Bsw20308]ATG79548.1 type VI secretion protein [Pseudoalteromonas sp. 1_2015MBL_MicDiv]KDC53085.1 type VI secretion protein [Pseudoalteromonas fuliginea]KDC53923.1 type VI secretion protein [Pseudoalteromonas sp. S3431]KJZ29263.1 type VI secretion protein [Pseudoalteromonas fuliginea]
MSDTIINIGYLGKVPSLGDFVQDNVSKAFSEHWEQWLQAAIAVSKEQLGEAWQDNYLVAPVWHFALSPNIVGDNGVMGTIIPSMDAVGRHYPFTLLSETQSDPIAILNSGVFSLEYEDVVLKVLEGSVDLFSWRKEVTQTLNIMTAEKKQVSYSHSPDKNKAGEAFEFSGTELSDNVLEDAMHAILHKKHGDYSVWWTHGSFNIKPMVLITSALPPVNQVAAMLDGRWKHWEWNYTQVKNSD